MITRKIANNDINTAIRGVVPQPGVTLPYSEFKGFSKIPRLVTNPPSTAFCLTLVGFFKVTIKKLTRRKGNINLHVLQRDHEVLSMVVRIQYK
jgi:hypothetical protein